MMTILPNHDPVAHGEVLAAQRDEVAQTGTVVAADPVQRCDLGEFLVIQQVMSVCDHLKQALLQGSVLVLGVDRLEQVDGAGVQLLCAVMKEAKVVGARIEWEGHSAALQESARRMGLAAFLGFNSP